MISTLEKVLFLKSIDLFSQIPGEDLARVAHIAEEIDFEDGDVLMREGELGDSMYLLVDGAVSVIQGSQHITTLRGGECVGEMAILDSEPRSATVTAAESLRALRIEREDFYELMSEKMEIAQGVIQVLTRRLRASNSRA